jgi:hypothetical protein
MSESVRHSEDNDAKRGFVGYFDLLGYRSLIANNHICEVIGVVKTIKNIIEDQHTRVIESGRIAGQKFCEFVVYSDSILVYTSFPENSREQHSQVAIFLEFCGDIISELFWVGLPVRGAWAFGDYYVEKTENGIYLAGMPIVEAYEFSNRIDMLGCVIAPSAEKVLAGMQILETPSELPVGYIQHFVPLKNDQNQKFQKQELFLLNHYHRDLHYHPSRIISRQIVMEKFAEHNKRIGVEVLPKINNTLEFLKACKPDA